MNTKTLYSVIAILFLINALFIIAIVMFDLEMKNKCDRDGEVMLTGKYYHCGAI